MAHHTIQYMINTEEFMKLTGILSFQMTHRTIQYMIDTAEFVKLTGIL